MAADLTFLRRQPTWAIPTSSLPVPRAITIPTAQKILTLHHSLPKSPKKRVNSESVYQFILAQWVPRRLEWHDADCAGLLYHCMWRAKHRAWNTWFWMGEWTYAFGHSEGVSCWPSLMPPQGISVLIKVWVPPSSRAITSLLIRDTQPYSYTRIRHPFIRCHRLAKGRDGNGG